MSKGNTKGIDKINYFFLSPNLEILIPVVVVVGRCVVVTGGGVVVVDDVVVVVVLVVPLSVIASV